MTVNKISLVVLSWNGQKLLEQNLVSVIKATTEYSLPSEVIVVDNGSTDGTKEYINNTYPEVKLVYLSRNMRFTGGNNAGAKAAIGNILIFLNNDVEVTPDFIEPLVEHFDQLDIFAVGCNILMRGVRKESGLTRGYFRRGLLQVKHSWEEYNKLVPILYASGAAFACDKKKFMELGGFDTVWDPFYWEDVDLCYRAWKRGWRVLFEPKSIVYHMHQATNNPKNFTKFFLELPKERNRYLFIWKNISQPRYLLYHFSLLPFLLLSKILKFQFIRFLAFFTALVRLPQAIYSGIKYERYRKLSDSGILKRTSEILYYKKLYNYKKVNQERLYILYICPYLPFSGISAGAGRMFEIIKRLSKKHHVDVISFIIEEELKYLPVLKNICNRVDVVKRNYPWRKDSLSILPSMINEFYCKEMSALIKRRLYEEDYDIVQFEYLHMSQYVPAEYSGKLVLTEHQLHFFSRMRDFLNERFLIKKFEALLSALKGMIYEIKACEKFDKVITMTQQEKRIFKAYLPYLNVESVPMGVDINIFESANDTAEKTDILYLGFFRHYPNVDAVLYFYKDILPLIKRKLAEVTFNIVGYAPPGEILKISGNGINVVGYVKDIRPYLDEAKVFIMPIRLGTGMRGKLFEAWAMKKAVISTSIGCEGVDVEDGRDILIADKPKDFAEKTIELIKNARLRRILGENARAKTVSLYNWDTITEKIEDIYKKLL